MKHRSVTHSFMLLPIPNPSAEQAQVPVFSVSGTKPAARPDLLLSSESSLGRANAKIHQSGQHRLNLNSSSQFTESLDNCARYLVTASQCLHCYRPRYLPYDYQFGCMLSQDNNKRSFPIFLNLYQ